RLRDIDDLNSIVRNDNVAEDLAASSERQRLGHEPGGSQQRHRHPDISPTAVVPVAHSRSKPMLLTPLSVDPLIPQLKFRSASSPACSSVPSSIRRIAPKSGLS